MNKKMYTLSEIKEMYGLSKGYLMQLIKTKALKAFKVGNIWRVKEEDLIIFIESCESNE